MLNNDQNNKLDETVKQTLGNYEVSLDMADWNNMESLLDAAPKSTSFFNWKYPLYVFIGIIIFTSGYFIYTSFHSKSIDKTDISIPLELNNTIVAPAKSVTTTPEGIPATAVVTATPTDTIKPNVPINTNAIVPSVVANPQTFHDDSGKAITSSEKIKTKNKKQINENNADEFNRNTRPSENEAVFGTAADSAKSISGEIKEKEETKKHVKSTTPVGWNSLLINVNPDSIRKNRERMKKDSVNQ